MHFQLVLLPTRLLMASEAQQEDVVGAVALQFVREMRSVEGGNHVESRVVACLPTTHALVLSVSYVEIVII